MYALVGLLAVISLTHYCVGGTAAGMLHSLLGHLYIVPIILGAYWYGMKGGVIVSITSVALFSPHLFLHWRDPFLDVYNFVELFLFLLIGGVTGVLSETSACGMRKRCSSSMNPTGNSRSRPMCCSRPKNN